MLGPIFGAACLAATCTGVVVLALLLGSILAAALQGPPDQSLVRDRRQPRRAVRAWSATGSPSLDRQSSSNPASRVTGSGSSAVCGCSAWWR